MYNKSSAFNAFLFAFFAIIQLLACQKKPVIVSPEEPQCRLKLVKVTEFASPYTIRYNDFGDPISARKGGYGTGNPEFYFAYDEYNRLRDFIGAYEMALDSLGRPIRGSFEYEVRYVYADNNPLSRPIGDSLRIFGYYNNGVSNAFYPPTPRRYTYDEQGRIIRLTQGDLSTDYVYDENGNLVRPDVVYDSKKNYRGRNKVFMLVDQNYSVNNPFTATAYNPEGFPISASPNVPGPRSHDFFLRRVTNFSMFEYDCFTSKTNF